MADSRRVYTGDDFADCADGEEDVVEYRVLCTVF
jgi:hypothetical protein